MIRRSLVRRATSALRPHWLSCRNCSNRLETSTRKMATLSWRCSANCTATKPRSAMRPQNGPKQTGFPRAGSPPTFGQTLDRLAPSMNLCPKKIMTVLLGLLAISGIDGRGEDSRGAPAIKAIQEDEKTIRVIVQGQFETTFTKRKGFGGVWFDLKHDPQRKRDLAGRCAVAAGFPHHQRRCQHRQSRPMRDSKR